MADGIAASTDARPANAHRFRLGRSKRRDRLTAGAVLAAALTACQASLVYAVPWYVTATILIALLGLRRREWRSAACRTSLSREGDAWTLIDGDEPPSRSRALGTRAPRPAEGSRPAGNLVLVRGGYRSAWLVVLRFRDRDGRRHDVDVWRDAVSADDFSRLVLAHRFETSDDARGTSVPQGRVSSHPTAIPK